MDEKNDHLNEADIALLYDIKENRKPGLSIESKKLEHFNNCKHCQDVYNDLKSFLLSNQYTSNKKKNRYLYYLSAAVIFVVLGVNVFDNYDIDRSRFVPNKQYETLVGQSFRADLTEIIEPGNNEIYSDRVSFKWKSSEQGPFSIVILNNKLKTIDRLNTAVMNVDFNTDSLEPGLYYWKLTNEYDLIYVGKFNVK